MIIIIIILIFVFGKLIDSVESVSVGMCVYVCDAVCCIIVFVSLRQSHGHFLISNPIFQVWGWAKRRAKRGERCKGSLGGVMRGGNERGCNERGV